jgi:glucosyl-3-phosphoglycerate synthase
VIVPLGSFDLTAVRRHKAERGLTTSVVVPARNEERHVASVLAALLPLTEPDADGVALVDELLVVDGGSTDATRERAAAAGVRVSVQPGPARGKGAALQHGVRETTGDLIAFVDADVHDPHAGLAAGPLAALIMDPALRLVKAAYDRPFSGSGATDTGPVGGGRVTELTVRPLLALLWPDLADVTQPLAGEYAADRALLSALPFEAGYGVELGLLIDTARHCGRAAIGEVDLGRRSHDHQPLAALGRMATELLLVALDRLAAEGRALPTGADEAGVPAGGLTALSLPQPRREEAGMYARGPDVRRTEVVRRVLPPLVATTPAAPVSGDPHR